MDKKAYVVFKVVEHFHPYLLKSQTKLIVPYPTVRNIFVQKELGEVCTHWMNTLQEYHLEIKLAKVVQCQGLCQMVMEVVVNYGWENEVTMYEVELVKVVDAP